MSNPSHELHTRTALATAHTRDVIEIVRTTYVKSSNEESSQRRIAVTIVSDFVQQMYRSCLNTLTIARIIQLETTRSQLNSTISSARLAENARNNKREGRTVTMPIVYSRLE